MRHALTMEQVSYIRSLSTLSSFGLGFVSVDVFMHMIIRGFERIINGAPKLDS